MTRKVLASVVILFLVFSIGTVFAEKGPGPLGMSAVGVFGSLVGNATGDTGAGLGILLSWNAKPQVGMSWSFTDEAKRFGLFTDFWVVDAPIYGSVLKYWVAVGLYGGIASIEEDDDKDIEFDVGARLPLGIRFLPIPKVDIFVELVPMVKFVPEIDLTFSADVGLRVHF